MTNKFTGFPVETNQFLRDLKAHNDKTWFDDNRDRYVNYWKLPAFGLIDAVADRMAALSPPLKAEARINGTLRRINRDVRFSRDKSPYNPRIHMIFWAGSHPNKSVAFHLVVHGDGLGYGAGVFGLDSNTLDGYRQRICDPIDRARLLQAVRRAEAAGCRFDAPDLKRLPSGYEADADWEHLLRRKAFVLRTIEDVQIPGWLHSADCAEQVMAIVDDLLPVIRWLNP